MTVQVDEEASLSVLKKTQHTLNSPSEARTIREMEPDAGVGLPVGKVLDDTIDVLRSGHEQIHGLHIWLWRSVRCYEVDCCVEV